MALGEILQVSGATMLLRSAEEVGGFVACGGTCALGRNTTDIG